MQDKEAELDTLRKAGKNLRERLDEKEVETRGIMDRVRLPQGFDATVLRLSVVALLSDPLVVLGTCLHSYAFIYGRFKYGCLTLIRLRVLLYGRFYERLAYACLSCPVPDRMHVSRTAFSHRGNGAEDGFWGRELCV